MMYRSKRCARSGFTLVELMIVVAIIGVLAGLAIYGVRRYLSSARTSEAKNMVGAISRAAASSYEHEMTASQLAGEGTMSAASSYALCASTGPDAPGHGPVPSAIALVAATKYQPITAAGSDFETGTSRGGWRCLRFSTNQPISYQYHYNAGGGYVSQGLPGAPALVGESFEAVALGDTDADTTVATFARVGTVNTATRHLIVATSVYINNEFE